MVSSIFVTTRIILFFIFLLCPSANAVESLETEDCFRLSDAKIWGHPWGQVRKSDRLYWDLWEALSYHPSGGYTTANEKGEIHYFDEDGAKKSSRHDFMGLSGIIASHDHPGSFYMVSDHEEGPVVVVGHWEGQRFVLQAQLTLAGFVDNDWEDIAIAPALKIVTSRVCT